MHQDIGNTFVAEGMSSLSVILGVETKPGYECLIRSNLRPTTFCPNPGELAVLITNLLIQLNISYSLAEISQKVEENYANLSNHEIDLIATNTWYITEERLKMGYPFSIPFFEKRTYSALFAKRNHKPRLEMTTGVLKYVEVFTPEVWLMMVVVYVVYKAYIKLARRFLIKIPLIPTFFLYLIVGLTLGTYKKSLLANILTEIDLNVFNDFEGMLKAIEQGDIHLILSPGIGWYTAMFTDDVNITQPDAVRRFRTTMQTHPPAFEVDYCEKMRHVREGSHFWISTTQYLTSSVMNFDCSLTSVELPELGSVVTGIMYSPKTPRKLISMLDESLMKTADQQQRLTEMTTRNDVRKAQPSCEHDHEPTIKFNSVFTVLVVVGVVYMVAILMVIVEGLAAKMRKFRIVADYCNL